MIPMCTLLTALMSDATKPQEPDTRIYIYIYILISLISRNFLDFIRILCLFSYCSSTRLCSTVMRLGGEISYIILTSNYNAVEAAETN